jgi:hypothetical protein
VLDSAGERTLANGRIADPDTDLPNSVHAYQTAERARELHPDKDWLHLVGLIHDVGKMMAVVDKSMPQWAVVGDTFPVGCRFERQSNVYSEVRSGVWRVMRGHDGRQPGGDATR